jgi:hypothetical protein
MLEKLLGRFPTNLIIISSIMSALVPWIFYKINQKLHKYGDPPWKKGE